MTQSPIGMFEYSSYPMNHAKDTFYDYFPGDLVFKYLDDFSQSKSFAGKTVKDRVKFGSHVQHISKEGGLWILQTDTGLQYTCHKLIMAIELPQPLAYLNSPTTISGHLLFIRKILHLNLTFCFHPLFKISSSSEVLSPPSTPLKCLAKPTNGYTG